MQDAKNGASLSALNTASRGAATMISPTKFKTVSLARDQIVARITCEIDERVEDLTLFFLQQVPDDSLKIQGP
jgi:hypothetical protein